MGTFYDPEFDKSPFESMTYNENWGQTDWKFRIARKLLATTLKFANRKLSLHIRCLTDAYNE